jgi:predicted nuclease with TOPRIM domain
MEMTELAQGHARLEAKLDQVLEEVKKINGRISQLEQWRFEKERLEAYQKGLSDGHSGVLLKRSHMVALFGIAPGIAALVSVAAEYVRG